MALGSGEILTVQVMILSAYQTLCNKRHNKPIRVRKRVCIFDKNSDGPHVGLQRLADLHPELETLRRPWGSHLEECP